MAWEWVAPTAGAVAAITIGLGGIIATYKSGNRQSDTALAVACQQADTQVAVTREERQQRRLEEAYLELLTAITKIHYWVFTVYPVMTRTTEEYTMPSLPELPDPERKEALWTALLVTTGTTTYGFARNNPAGAPNCGHEAIKPRLLLDRAHSIANRTEPPHSPPTPMPWIRRMIVSRTAPQTPMLA